MITKYNIKWFTLITILSMLLWVLLGKSCNQFRPQPTIAPVAQKRVVTYKSLSLAIYHTEGGKLANQLFGINPKYVKCSSFEQCQKVCINTIRSKYNQWDRKEPFLVYLSKRYCPPNHEVWLKNVKFFLKNPKEIL